MEETDLHGMASTEQSIQLLLVMQPQIIKLTQHHDLDSRTVESILHRIVTK
jgi:hypothetical protein